MLFNINKQKSLALLQLTAAVFILLVPSVVGILPVNTSTYFLFVLTCALFAVRIKTNERAFLSIYHFVYLLLGAYGVISMIWVNNCEGQLIFIFVMCILTAFHSLACDYFAENSADGIKRRLMYFISISGTLCSLLNILYWVISIVPVAGNAAFKQGMGTNDFLGIYMLFSVISTLSLLKGNSKLRKVMLVMAALLMVFVFIMAKSVAAWLFAAFLTLVFLIKPKIKSQKSLAVILAGFGVLFTVGVICVMAATTYGKAFADVFSYGAKNIFGAGGGFWSGKEIFLSGDYSDRLGVGILAYLFASCGALGIVCCVAILLRHVMLLFKLKTAESFLGLLFCICVMLLPFGENLAVILLWIGINAYNEQTAGMNFKLQIKKKNQEKTVYIIWILVIISCMLFVQSVIRINASVAYKNKEYTDAYELYRVSAILNLTDSESCRNAVSSLRKAGNLPMQCDEAVRIIDKAIKRDSDNLENIKEKALVYDACGEYELSAQQYRIASQRALNKDKYNLLLVKQLYKIVEKYAKGSSETKRAYEEIVEISQSTQNLDCRKEINDIADKALKFIRK